MPKTYEEVADQVKLDFRTKVRYLYYMRTRWADTEEQKCLDGYATEWANRFKYLHEFDVSDGNGQALLKEIPQILWYLFPKTKEE